MNISLSQPYYKCIYVHRQPPYYSDIAATTAKVATAQTRFVYKIVLISCLVFASNFVGYHYSKMERDFISKNTIFSGVYSRLAAHFLAPTFLCILSVLLFIIITILLCIRVYTTYII